MSTKSWEVQFEKSYTNAVNKLASNPSQKVTVSIPGGKDQVVTAAYAARSAANRMVEAAPSVTKTTAAAVTHGDGYDSLVTTVNAAGLRGAPVIPPAKDAEETRQLVAIHEAIHGTYVDNSFAGIKDFNRMPSCPVQESATLRL